MIELINIIKSSQFSPNKKKERIRFISTGINDFEELKEFKFSIEDKNNHKFKTIVS